MRDMSAFEVLIFSICTLKQNYNCEFEVWTDSRGMVNVKLRRGNQSSRFEVSEHTLEKDGFADVVLQRFLESLESMCMLISERNQ